MMRQQERHLIRSTMLQDGTGLDGAIEGAKDKAYLAGFQQGRSYLRNAIEEITHQRDELVEHLETLEEAEDE